MSSVKAQRDYYARNREKVIKRARQWVLEDPERQHRLSRKSLLRRRYNITPEQYDAMLSAQAGKCAICTRDKPGNGHDRYFDVDHCHETGRVRGLLCRQCNVMLGHLQKLNRPGMLAAVSKYLGFAVEYDPK